MAHGKNQGCSLCNKSFAASKNRKLRIRVHTREKPYSLQCTQSFSKCSKSSNGLKKHLRVNSEEKPYYRYYSKCNNLYLLVIKPPQEAHKIRTWEKPYSCSVCDESFKLLDALKNYLRLHTGEKHFSPVCYKSFTQSGSRVLLPMTKKNHTVVQVVSTL